MRVTLRQIVALGIANLHERQAVRWGRSPAQLAITGLHELTGPRDRRAAAADLHENANEISNHMMKKGIRTKLEHQEASFHADANRH